MHIHSCNMHVRYIHACTSMHVTHAHHTPPPKTHVTHRASGSKMRSRKTGAIHDPRCGSACTAQGACGVCSAGFALAGEQFAMQTVPTAVLVHAEGQVPLPVMLPVRTGGAVVHTANTKRAAAGRHVVSAQQTFFAHSCSPRVVASLDNCH